MVMIRLESIQNFKLPCGGPRTPGTPDTACGCETIYGDN